MNLGENRERHVGRLVPRKELVRFSRYGTMRSSYTIRPLSGASMCELKPRATYYAALCSLGVAVPWLYCQEFIKCSFSGIRMTNINMDVEADR